MKNTIENEIHQKIADTYVPLKELILEDNGKEIDVVKHFPNYSYVLASVELIIYSFATANPKIKDEDVLYSLKDVRRDPLYEFLRFGKDPLTFAIIYAMSRGLQHRKLAINEVNAILDWLIHEIKGRLDKDRSYITMLKRFFKNGENKFQM